VKNKKSLVEIHQDRFQEKLWYIKVTAKNGRKGSTNIYSDGKPKPNDKRIKQLVIMVEQY